VAPGPASFDDVRTVRVSDRVVTAGTYLLCAGARPVVPDLPGLTSIPFRTYHDIFDIDQLPASFEIVGGGPMGAELAQACQRLGAAVTIVAARLLPHYDRWRCQGD
jgi:pyruvate/2-oxoglutarate dehydrogenase complex dihydrolipoamide dehydrogenase (E3) component